MNQNFNKIFANEDMLGGTKDRLKSIKHYLY